MNTTTVNFRLSCEILRNFVVQNTPLGEIPLFCRSDNRFYRTRTAFTRILLEKVTFFLFIRKIGRFKYKSGDREICQEIGSLPIKSVGLERLRLSSAFFQWVALPTYGGICIYSKSPFKKLWLCGEEENNLISIIFSLSQPPVDQLSYPIIVLINTTIHLVTWLKPRLPSNTRHSFTKYLEYLEPSQVTTRCVAIYQNKDLETLEL